MQTLLLDSLGYYRKRQLKKALNTAQIALEFGLNESASNEDLIQAYLLLAKIYNTNGNYQNEPSFHQKAVYYLNEAKQLNEARTNLAFESEITRICGEISISLHDYHKAEICIEKSIALAQQCHDTEKELYGSMSLCHLKLLNNDLSGALALAENTLARYQASLPGENIPLKAKIYQQLSQTYIKRQDYSKSLEMSQELLRLSRQTGEVEKEIVALRNIAVVCGVKSNYKIGMQFFFEALDKSEAIGYRELIAQMQINIGTLYAHLYNYEEAIQRYESVLKEHSELLDERMKVVVYNNLGNIYLTTDRPETALEYFEQACSMAMDCKFAEMIAHSLAQSSRAKINLHRFNDASRDAKLAEDLYEKLGDVNGRQINLLNLGQLAYVEKNLEKSVERIEQAITVARRLKDDATEIRGYKHLSSTFKAIGNFEKALVYQERYAEIQEEYAKVQRSRQFLDLEIRNAIREKQKEIEQLTRDNDYKALLLEKSDQIARQNLELLRVNDELRQFAYVVSHDLKEPLRMIGAYTKLIENQAISQLATYSDEYFGYVKDGVSRMNDLLDGLLKYATIGSGELETTEVELQKIIPACLSNLKIRIEETNAQVYFPELPTVRGNAQLIVQLFQNLIGNALKFVRSGVPPVIHIRSIEMPDEFIVSVKDNGIGILPEYQQKIFEIFQRLHRRNEYEGTGIGLSICQKIVQKHNGRIWVESKEGEGATFHVAFPK